MTARARLRAAALAALLAGCVKVPVKPDFTKFLSAGPRSILVVPVVNNTVDVDAAAYFLSTMPVPVAERGYYVFPVNLVKRVLEDDGLSDAALVHAADPVRLCALFGADAALYVTIERWEAKYVVLATTVTVAFSYVIKDGKTGDTLWKEDRVATYSSDPGGGGSGGGAGGAAVYLVAAIVNAAVTKASPDYMSLARSANASAMGPAGTGFPFGPYRPEYGTDYQRPDRPPPPPPRPKPSPAPEPEPRPGW